jgi:hypothetical protein
VEFTAWLESTGLSVWVRESTSIAFGFPGILTLHAIGMGFLVGTCAAVDLRILGFAPRVSLSQMERFFPVMWFGFAVNAISGVLLLVGYPTKALTNPLFYVKLGCIAVGMAIAMWLGKTVIRSREWDFRPLDSKRRTLAFVSLAFWVGAIFAGRLLAYTCTQLMADMKC